MSRKILQYQTDPISKDELIKSIQLFVKKNGRIPTRAEASPKNMTGNGLYGATTYQNNFGTWSKAIEAAGYIPRVPYSKGKKKYSDEELLKIVREFYFRHASSSTFAYASLKAKGSPVHKTITIRFGSFKNALNLAGIKFTWHDYLLDYIGTAHRALNRMAINIRHRKNSLDSKRVNN